MEITEDDTLAVMNAVPVLRSELVIMSQLNDHPCILRLIGVCTQQLLFAMEFAPLGDLASYVHEQYILTRPQLMSQRVFMDTILPRMLTYKIALQVSVCIMILTSVPAKPHVAQLANQ